MHLKHSIQLALGIIILIGLYFFLSKNEFPVARISMNQQGNLTSAISNQKKSASLEQKEISTSANTLQKKFENLSASEIFTQYLKGNMHGVEGQILLDTVRGKKLERTTFNYKTISDLLKSNISSEEKATLAKLLGDFYSQNDVEGLNARILDDLRQFSGTNDATLGRAITLTYSRLGFFPDSEQMLASALSLKQISSQEYYGELSHLLPYAPAGHQKIMINSIISGNQPFSAEILTSLLQDDRTRNRISPDALTAVKSFILQNEPKFPIEQSEFGLMDAVRYGEWAKSYSMLTGNDGSKQTTPSIVMRLTNSQADPRQIIAYLITPEGQEYMTQTAQKDVLSKLLERVNEYASKNPTNSTIQDVAALIRSKSKI